MNTQEKRAWFILSVLVITLAIYLLLGFATGFHVASLGAFGFLGLVGGAPLIGCRERRAGKVTFDERDSEIDRVATLVGYIAFWEVLVLGVMIPFFIFGPNTQITVPVYMFPAFLVPAVMVVLGIRALVTVVLYRRRSHA